MGQKELGTNSANLFQPCRELCSHWSPSVWGQKDQAFLPRLPVTGHKLSWQGIGVEPLLDVEMNPLDPHLSISLSAQGCSWLTLFWVPAVEAKGDTPASLGRVPVVPLLLSQGTAGFYHGSL